MATTERGFTKATEYRSYNGYCPGCENQRATFHYVRTETEGCCEGGARRVFECETCGLERRRPAVDFSQEGEDA